MHVLEADLPTVGIFKSGDDLAQCPFFFLRDKTTIVRHCNPECFIKVALAEPMMFITQDLKKLLLTWSEFLCHVRLEVLLKLQWINVGAKMTQCIVGPNEREHFETITLGQTQVLFAGMSLCSSGPCVLKRSHNISNIRRSG